MKDLRPCILVIKRKLITLEDLPENQNFKNVLDFKETFNLKRHGKGWYIFLEHAFFDHINKEGMNNFKRDFVCKVYLEE